MIDFMVDNLWIKIAAFAAILVAIFRDVLVNVISQHVQKFRFSDLSAYKNYKIALKNRLAEMPFLYRDMRLSARDDYVETTLSTADGKARPFGQPKLDYRTPFARFKESRRAILFGNGGFGKTTLFRHLILRMLDPDTEKIVFGQRLMPIFVALKATKLSSEFPILDSIQQSDPIFAGEAGYKRLRGLAKKGKLVIFLDGYDELPYAGGLEHVKEEIETLFGNHIERAPTFYEARKDFYLHAQQCRIYISSRREFFLANPFDVARDIPKWVARGLGDRRPELVRNIFLKYKNNNPYLENRLDEELFLQQLAESCDSNLVDLSASPLFLTVMCYIYVDAVREDEANGAAVFLKGSHGLIESCINLLIADVDEFKARGLSDVQRTALVNRRSAYREEKYEFLRYFSAKTYEQEISIFDRVALIEFASSFFRTSHLSAASKIERGLRESDPTVNIIDQLIYCGLFVAVDTRGSSTYYDFPHRRFKETLAVSYYNDIAGAEVIAQNFSKPVYSELALVYMEQSTQYPIVLDRILHTISNGSYERGYGEFFLSALSRIGQKEAATYAKKFVRAIIQNQGSTAPEEILSFLPRDESYIEHLVGELRSAIAGGSKSVSSCLMCLVAVSAAESKKVIVEKLPEMQRDTLRNILFTPVEFDQGVEEEMGQKCLFFGGSRNDMQFALSDLFRVIYIGAKPERKDSLRNLLRQNEALIMDSLQINAGKRNYLIKSLEHEYGGITVPEDFQSCVPPFRDSRPRPVAQFYSRHSNTMA